MSAQNFQTDCFTNLTIDERLALFKRIQGLRLDSVYKTYLGWLCFPFALVGLILTVCFILTVYQAIKRRRVSRKCYLLLLNRTIGDFFSCLTAFTTCMYIFFSREPNKEVISLFDIFFAGSFWSAMVSYCSLSLLKLLAVARPFEYRKLVTMRRCIQLIIISWIFFSLVVTYTLTVSALVKVPMLNELTHCKMETCLRFMYRSRNFFTVVVYVFTLVVFVITVILLRRERLFHPTMTKNRSTSLSTDSSGRVRSSRFPLWKLALNVATFAFLNLFYVIWCLGLVINNRECFFMQNYSQLMRILAIIRMILLLRISLDPIITFFTDYQIRRGFLTMLGVQRKITFSSSRGMVQRSTVMDDNESSTDASRRSRNLQPDRPQSQKKLKEEEALPDVVDPAHPPESTITVADEPHLEDKSRH